MFFPHFVGVACTIAVNAEPLFASVRQLSSHPSPKQPRPSADRDRQSRSELLGSSPYRQIPAISRRFIAVLTSIFTLERSLAYPPRLGIIESLTYAFSALFSNSSTTAWIASLAMSILL